MHFVKRSGSRVRSPIAWPVLAVTALVVLAIITSVWAVTSHTRMSSLESEIAELRSNAHASVFALEATESAPTGTQGQVFLTLSGSGAVTVSNLPNPGDNEEFHLWFLKGDGDTAMAGGTLIVNANGQGFALIPADTADYTQIAVSLEPVGVNAPGGTFLLMAEVGSGRG
jgi:hypothetical protein